MAKRKGRRRAWGSVYLRGGMWWIAYRHKGKRVKKAVSPELEIAEQALAEVRRRIDRGEHLGIVDLVPITLAEFWAQLSAARRVKLRPSSFRAQDGQVRVAARHFEERQLSEINAQEVADFLTGLRRSDPDPDAKPGATVPVSPATRNRYRAALAWVWGEAVTRGHAGANVVDQIKPEPEELLPREYLALADLDRLVECIGARFRPLVIVAADTGLRRGEVCRLQWRDVDLTAGRHGVVVVRHAKAKRSRTVPLTGRASDTLKALNSERTPEPGNEWVFPAYSGPHGGGCVTRAFRRACAKAGTRFEGLRFHDLRHGYASALVRAGVDIPTVGRLLGHAPSSLSTTMRYSGHAPSSAEHDAVAALEAGRDEAARVRREAH